MGAPSGPSKREMADMDAESDLRSLTRAEEIRSDGKKLSNIRRYVGRQQKLVGRVLSKARKPGGKR